MAKIDPIIYDPLGPKRRLMRPWRRLVFGFEVTLGKGRIEGDRWSALLTVSSEPRRFWTRSGARKAMVR